MIDWTILRSKFGRKGSADRFEQLALRYVQDLYPELTWEKTPPVGDGNRDGYAATDDEYQIWEEAKYRNGIKKNSDKRDRALERKDVDSAVLSGLIYGKVRLIIFVTNAPIPSEVMMRSVLGARIRGIEVTCVLAAQLEQWLATHKKVYRQIFEESFPRGKRNVPSSSLVKAQLYDPLSVDFSPLKKRKDFYVGERAILELIVYADKSSNSRIKLMDYPFDLIEDPGYSSGQAQILPAGMSNLLFLVQMKEAGTKSITICLELNGTDYYQQTESTTILPLPKEPLSYSKQLQVILQMHRILQNAQKYDQGMIVTLYAGSSMGKSFVLRSILEQFCIQYDITLITFDSNRQSLSNYTLLCKIVLFLFYGNIFWDMASTTKAKRAAFKAQVLAADQGELFSQKTLSALVDGCFDSTLAADAVCTLLKHAKRSEVALVKGRRTKTLRILLLDDVQYLDGVQMEFFQLLLGQLATNHHSNVIVASATQGRFSNSKAEKFFCELSPNRFELDGLSATDKCEILHRTFQLPRDEAETIAENILPCSPLLAKEILSNISANINAKACDADYLLLSYMHHINDVAILEDKFSNCREQFYLLDIIYKFKKGIALKALTSYPAFDRKQLNKDLKLLVATDLINQNDGVLSPYHDYYVAAYQRLRGQHEYGPKLGKFFEHLLTSKRYVDPNQVLAMLLHCGKRYAKTYRAQVKEYILKYIHETQFGAALHFCEYYYAQLSPINAHSNISHEEWYLLYLHADCLVHCDRQKRAARLLEEIYRFAPDDSVSKYEAGASLLNQNFWAIRPQKVIADSLSIQSGVERIKERRLGQEDNRRMEKAYDSCFNRRMVSFLLLDQNDSAKKIYINRLKSILNGNKANFKSDAATLIMDYARGISYQEPAEAYRLMKIAFQYFETAPTQHYRRIQLCLVDLAVLASITEKRFESQMILNAKQELHSGNFWSEYFKAIIKESACKLVDFCNQLDGGHFPPDAQILSDVETELREALIETQIQPHGRELLLWNYLRAFSSAIKGNYSIAQKCLDENIKIMEQAGKSHLVALKHNCRHIESVRRISWATLQSPMDTDVFYLDCRFW